MQHKATPFATVLLCLFILFYATAGFADAEDSWRQVYLSQLKLAEQGNVKAQYIIGEMYEQGRGTEKDVDTAIAWFHKAEQNGHKRAANRIVRIKENIRLEALAKSRAEEEAKRLKNAQARQAVLQKKAAEARSKEEKIARQRAAKQAQQAAEEAKLSPEERAKKIKAAQNRALAIAKQNALRQQQAADAELRRYRASLQTTPEQKNTTTANPKYQDAFE